jgi:hypothetical protein
MYSVAKTKNVAVKLNPWHTLEPWIQYGESVFNLDAQEILVKFVLNGTGFTDGGFGNSSHNAGADIMPDISRLDKETSLRARLDGVLNACNLLNEAEENNNANAINKSINIPGIRGMNINQGFKDSNSASSKDSAIYSGRSKKGMNWDLYTYVAN